MWWDADAVGCRCGGMQTRWDVDAVGCRRSGVQMRWDVTQAPSNTSLPSCARGRTGHRGNRDDEIVSRGSRKPRVLASLSIVCSCCAAECKELVLVPSCCDTPWPPVQQPTGDNSKYSRLKTGKVTADLCLMQMFPMFCSIVLPTNKIDQRQKEAFGIACVTWPGHLPVERGQRVPRGAALTSRRPWQRFIQRAISSQWEKIRSALFSSGLSANADISFLPEI